MSDSLAIAAVTATLRSLLQNEIQALGDATLGTLWVTTLPPDKAKARADKEGHSSFLNLFLYQTAPDAAWRNMDMPGVRPGEAGHPPLPLTLHYLLTAYGLEGNDTADHRLLGHALQVLHDHPLLGADEIKLAQPDTSLPGQVERVRLTPATLSIDEMSRLWTTLQSPYRISTAWQASVVLIESKRPLRAPLPVLTRGPGDKGVVAQASTAPPLPMLSAAVPPGGQSSARLGDAVSLQGLHLDAGAVTVQLSNPRLGQRLQLTAAGGTATALTVQLPAAPPYDPAGSPSALPKWPVNWGPGIYSLAVAVGSHQTNAVPAVVAPQVTNISPSPHVQGDVTYTVTVKPQVQPGQQVSLLLGASEVHAQPTGAAPTDTLTFVAKALPPGDYWVRLRVDGVDSLLVDNSPPTPQFIVSAVTHVVITP